MSIEGKNKKKEGTDSKSTKLRVSDLLVPLISGIIFIFVLIFSIIPMIQEIEQTLSEIDSVQQEQGFLEDKIQSIKSLDLIELENALRDANRVIPRGLQVSEYAYYVDSLAKEKDLEFRGILARDQFSPRLGDGVDNIAAVGADIEYRGTFDDVVNFFNELQAYSPYIISMGDIAFAKMNTGVFLEEEEEFEDVVESEWRFEIRVTGYYARDLAQRPSARELTSGPFIAYYQNNQDAIEIFREKAQKLEQEMPLEDIDLFQDLETEETGLDESQDLFFD